VRGNKKKLAASNHALDDEENMANPLLANTGTSKARLIEQ